MPNPTQSEISRGTLPVKKLVEVVTFDPANLKIGQPQSERPRLGKRVLLALPITLCIGVAATLAWQSRGDAAKKAIASAFPQLGWLAPQAAPVAQNPPDVIAPTAPATPSPDQQQFNAMSLDLDAVHSVGDPAASAVLCRVCGQRAIDGRPESDQPMPMMLLPA